MKLNHISTFMTAIVLAGFMAACGGPTADGQDGIPADSNPGSDSASSGGTADQPAATATASGQSKGGSGGSQSGGNSRDDHDDHPDADLNFPTNPPTIPLSKRAITAANVADIVEQQIIGTEEADWIDDIVFIYNQPFLLGGTQGALIPFNLDAGRATEHVPGRGKRLLNTNNEKIILDVVGTINYMYVLDVTNLGGLLIARTASSQDWLTEAALSPDNTRLATVYRQSGLLIWSFPGNERLGMLPHERSLNHLAYSPDGQYLLTAISSGEVLVWAAGDLEATEPLTRWNAHIGPIERLAFNPTGKILATTGNDGMVKLWAFSPDGTAELLVETDAGHEEAMTHTLAFSPDGSLLATASQDGTVHLWSVPGGELLRELALEEESQFGTGWVNSVRFSPDGSLLAMGIGDGTVHLWGLND